MKTKEYVLNVLDLPDDLRNAIIAEFEKAFGFLPSEQFGYPYWSISVKDYLSTDNEQIFPEDYPK